MGKSPSFHRDSLGRKPWFLIAMLATLLIAGCGIPRDPEGTFQQVHARPIRVGFAENDLWVQSNDIPPRGIEVELIERFAEQLGTTIQWHRGAESRLLDSLHRGKLDVVIGGLTDDTPWASKIGMTQPYVEIGKQRHIMAVRPGENRWLLELDRFLQSPAVQEKLDTELARPSA